MLVLSRKIGESIVFDELLILTLLMIGNGYIELSLAECDGGHLKQITLTDKQFDEIIPGVSAMLVKVHPEGRVRLGIEYSKDVSIRRREDS